MELLALLFLSFCFLTLSGRTFAAESGTPVTTVTVKEDDDVILPCSLSTNVNIEKVLFDWKKEGTVPQKEVFMYVEGNHYNNGLPGQDEQFRDRVSHFPEELKYGNASIRIKQTKLEDKGIYTCDFPRLLPEPKIFRIELVVGAAPKPYVKMLKDKGLLECEVPGASPKPTVEWWDRDNKTLPSKTLQDTRDDNRFYITIQTTVTKPGCYYCVATQMEIWHQISSETCVPEVSDSTGWVVAGVVSVVLVGVLVGVAVLKAKGYNCKKDSPRETSLSSNSRQQHDDDSKQPLDE
ncbi:V-set and immunoglobulin domain-containing protein 1 isoform X2 [Haplochromis burtoni]|uniref:V-set domain-containing T-cell activation inhibitor 1-like n=1 Tax=Haplochromis burtoni TaxID=8153 RepID=A0A3Q2WDM3_HAPBU|nr:V-set and immunoglobulin domain-containing protein 1 isoform X2 [Haplochromis burtoni]